MCTGCLTGQCHPDLLGKQGPRRAQAAADAAAAREEAAGLRARLAAADAAAAELEAARGQLAAAQAAAAAELGAAREQAAAAHAAAAAAQAAARAADARGAERDDAAARERDALQEQARAAGGPLFTLRLSYIRGERLPEPQALAGHALRCEALQRMRAGPRPACHAMPSLAVAEICRTCRAAAWSCVLRAARERRCGTSDAQRSGCKTSGFAATSCNKDLPKAHSARPRMH